MKSKLEQWRDSSAVVRFHTLRQIKYQTIAQHSHGVACLAVLVEPDCSAMLLKAALTHDFHEQHIGDMPSTAKRMFPELGEYMNEACDAWDLANNLDWDLTDHERMVLKFCDYFELLLWSLEEYDMGNKYARAPIINVCRWLDTLKVPTKEAVALYKQARVKAVDRLGALENYYDQEDTYT